MFMATIREKTLICSKTATENRDNFDKKQSRRKTPPAFLKIVELLTFGFGVGAGDLRLKFGEFTVQGF